MAHGLVSCKWSELNYKVPTPRSEKFRLTVRPWPANSITFPTKESLDDQLLSREERVKQNSRRRFFLLAFINEWILLHLRSHLFKLPKGQSHEDGNTNDLPNAKSIFNTTTHLSLINTATHLFFRLVVPLQTQGPHITNYNYQLINIILIP